MGIYEKLSKVQFELKCEKSQYNNFGEYSYRSAEDILTAIKPFLNQNKLALIIKDNIEMIGNRFYIKSTVNLFDIENGEHIETSAYAREPENRKKQDDAQVTGASSSYARKYALNGLFAIDDTKDPDATNTHGKENNLYLCEKCGQAIKGYKKSDGTKVTSEQLYNSTGVCLSCWKAKKNK